jgi:hypothetical protein
MAEPRDYAAADSGLPLPGLQDQANGVTELETAVRRSLAALDAAGLLTEVHAMPMQLVLDLARAVGLGTRSGRASAAALAAAQLREAWALLPALDATGSGGDEWDALAVQLRREADAERARQRRDATQQP